MRAQNKNWVRGRKVKARCLEVWRIGTTSKMRTDANRARTPPNLLGIERRMAYANRKYHSGLICGGVTSGFAGMKLSGSPKRLGAKSASDVSAIRTTMKPTRSLYEKYGWKEILSALEFNPRGLLEPVSCRNNR